MSHFLTVIVIICVKCLYVSRLHKYILKIMEIFQDLIYLITFILHLSLILNYYVLQCDVATHKCNENSFKRFKKIKLYLVFLL